MKYPVALTQTEEGYSVCCPGLPGFWSQGTTEDEALANIRDAIHEYLEVARQLGDHPMASGDLTFRDAASGQNSKDGRIADLPYPGLE